MKSGFLQTVVVFLNCFKTLWSGTREVSSWELTVPHYWGNNLLSTLPSAHVLWDFSTLAVETQMPDSVQDNPPAPSAGSFSSFSSASALALGHFALGICWCVLHSRHQEGLCPFLCSSLHPGTSSWSSSSLGSPQVSTLSPLIRENASTCVGPAPGSPRCSL